MLDTAVLYVNIDTGDIISLFVVSVSSSDSFPGKIKEVFLFDSDTTVGFGFREAGSRKGFILTNSSRKIVIKCFKRRIAERWVRTIKAGLGDGPGRELASEDKR